MLKILDYVASHEKVKLVGGRINQLKLQELIDEGFLSSHYDSALGEFSVKVSMEGHRRIWELKHAD